MKKFLKRITPILIAVILFTVPLFFSHILKVFGLPIVFGSSSYERIKVDIFYFFLVFLVPLWGVSPYFHTFWVCMKKKHIILLLGICFSLFGISTFLSPDIQLSLIGGEEKQHGIIFYTSLILFAFILKSLPVISHIRFMKISFFSSIFVLLYALMQWVGLDQLESRYVLNFSEYRVFSTLGNPNYLAGYFLLLLPFLQKIFKNQNSRNLAYGILFFGIIITGSFLGISIAVVYIGIKLFFFQKQDKGVIFITLLFSLIGIVSISPIILSEKIGSLEHRFIIGEASIHMLVESPTRIVFGYGPEQFQSLFPSIKPKIDPYTIIENTPDNTHNIFLDIAFSFGFMGLIFFFIVLVKFFYHRPLSDLGSEGMILFLLFFSFNIAVLVHFLLLILAISFSSRTPHVSPPSSNQ